MSLNCEPLPLEPSPRSVQQARHWTSSVVRAMGRSDLCESAELGVSELVTNAVLHAQPPLSVRVRGTRDHPRIEVADGSPDPPVDPDPDPDPDPGPGLGVNLSRDAQRRVSGRDTGPATGPATGPVTGAGGPATLETALALSTLGRGLGIVSMCARAWGAEIRREGKVVWFEPVSMDAAGQPARGAIFAQVEDLARRIPDEPLSPVVLQRVRLTLYTGFRQHFRELRRELRLLALAHDSEYPLAANLGTLLTDFEAHLRHADADAGIAGNAAGRANGQHGAAPPSGTRDLTMLVPRSTPQMVRQLTDLLDLTDAFCDAERLLSLARTPVQRQFQHWFLTELVRQAEGGSPSPWDEGGPAVGLPAS